jgi:hypothetical protein
MGSMIDASSFSGLFTRVEIGQIRISSAGYGREDHWHAVAAACRQ